MSKKRNITNHLINKGINNIYICSQIQEGFSISLAGYGALHKLQWNKRQHLNEPHKTAFLKIKDKPWTVNQDFSPSAKKYTLNLLTQDDTKWHSALKEVGSWCAIKIVNDNKKIQPTLLIATSNHKSYFTKNRLELLKKLAEYLAPTASFNYEWDKSEELQKSFAHNLGQRLADLNTFIKQENREGMRSMQPLIEETVRNLTFGTNSSDLMKKSKCSFQESLNALQPLKNHPDYAWILHDWKYWQAYNHKKLAINSSALQHILCNIFSNASYYSVENKFYLKFYIENNHMILHTCNKGRKSLTTYDRKNLLNMGFRPLEAPANGTGLGLGIIKELIEAHEGSINLCSKDCLHCKNSLSDTDYRYWFGLQLNIPLHEEKKTSESKNKITPS